MFEVGARRTGRRASEGRRAHRAAGRHEAPRRGPGYTRARDERTPVLEVHHLVKALPLAQGRGVQAARVGTVHAGGRGQLRPTEARRWGWSASRGSGKTTTLTQILELAPPQEGAYTVARARHRQAGPGRAQGDPARHAGRLPRDPLLASTQP
ncbi:hypothetical protein [Nonomuraea rubra]|uniref:hypothetical protein n=1 Tax=Nonomuraea rubra TaxID=46180 RepID=UPI0031F1B796